MNVYLPPDQSRKHSNICRAANSSTDIAPSGVKVRDCQGARLPTAKKNRRSHETTQTTTWGRMVRVGYPPVYSYCSFYTQSKGYVHTFHDFSGVLSYATRGMQTNLTTLKEGVQGSVDWNAEILLGSRAEVQISQAKAKHASNTFLPGFRFFRKTYHRTSARQTFSLSFKQPSVLPPLTA